MPNITSELPSNVVADTMALCAVVSVSSTNIQAAHLPCCYRVCGSECLSVNLNLNYSSGLSPRNIVFSVILVLASFAQWLEYRLKVFIIFTYYNLKLF